MTINNKIDSISIEVIGNLLLSVAEEMGAALIKSSYSSNIKERRDCSAAIFDAKGNLVAQAEHIPMHLGSMLDSIAAVLKKYPVEVIREGDVFIANDPYYGGGSHLPDIVFTAPVFVDRELIMWVANIAHHSDIGGIVPGSTSGEVTTIFQEGLRIPTIRVCREGEIINEIFDIIIGNCRTRKERVGDLNAQISANNVGIKRLKEAYQRYGDQLKSAMNDLQDYAENSLRASIARIKDGIYHFTEYVDDMDNLNLKEEIVIDVVIEVKGDNITLDFSNSSPQVPGNINVTYSGLITTVFYALKALIGPQLPSNSGIYRVFKVIAKPGTIVHAIEPGPVGERMSTCQRVVEAILGAMYKAMPEKIPACSHDGGTSVNFSGVNPRNNEFFIYPEGIAGGEGALMNRDGMSGVQVHMTNTSNQPIEALETENPLLITSYSLRRDSGGAGKHRGGLGIERVFCMLADNVSFTGHGGRQRLGAWGLDGGFEGECGGFYLEKKGEAPRRLSSVCSNIVVNKGDIIRVFTPGGGGFGDPEQRDCRSILRDIEEGKISLEKAEKLYGWEPQKV
jgi:N-methylhydantoinase B